MRLLLSFTAALLLANVAEAAGGCGTSACGIESHSCRSCNARTCKVVCEMVKVKKTVWVVECEEFCPMFPGCRPKTCHADCGEGCSEDLACGTCRGKDPCAAVQNRTIVPPKCGKTRYRKKLVKKVVTCEVPVYRCVVADCCSTCGMGEAAPVAAPAASRKVPAVVPLPPLVSSHR
jgi:hypothetical protein